MNHCFICDEVGMTETHHIFGAAMRQKSDRLGLVVELCRECHRKVHSDRNLMQFLHEQGQRKAMEENNWTIEDFRREFHKNYLEE